MKADIQFRYIVIGLMVFYAALVAAFSPSELIGDEGRYLFYAENLTNGFYVPPDFPDFTNGPAYPMILAPLVAIDAPIWMMRGLNVFFMGGAVFLLFQLLRIFVSARWATIIAVGFGLNPIQLRYIAHAKTEAVSVFFFCAFLYTLALLLRADKWNWRILAYCAGSFFALTMTRVLFGYVATAALVAVPVCCFIFGYRQQLLKATAPFALALAFCIPWLAYTHHHTGKHFCWSTNGGELLYWITSPHDGEWGSWFSLDDLAALPEAAERHMKVSAAIESAPFAEQDALWKQHAKENFQEDPKALARNLVANFSRIFFAFPRSYRTEELKTLCWLIPNAVVLFLAALAIYPTVRAWKRIPLAIKIAGLTGLIFFGGSVLLPAAPRYLLPVVPSMLLWLGYIYANVIQIRINVTNAEESNLSREQALA
ncbi:MAG: hypothetical protein AAF585_17005 [Verrucomicrobiota bacterium]